MDTEQTQTPTEAESSTLYIVGAVIIVAVIAAGVMLWPKQKPKTETATPIVEQKTMITKLTCNKQWFNPKIGFAQYYLGAEGEALTTAQGATCTFTIAGSVDKKVIVTESIPAVLTEVSERGGKTFICRTPAVDLPKGSSVMMGTDIKDDLGATASCAAGLIVLP
jgi:hypothetical protein